MATYGSALRREQRRKAGKMTLHEYLATPESVVPQELIFGAMRVSDSPFMNHQRVVLKMAIALQAHVEAHQAGEVVIAPMDVVLDAERALVLQPDLLFVSADRSDIVHEHIYGAPDLVVEVLSPHPRIGQLAERVGWFAEYGVREIWLYHQPAKRLDVLRCEKGVVSATTSFESHAPIQSSILPLFRESTASVIRSY